jgi:hypothetical protein
VVNFQKLAAEARAAHETATAAAENAWQDDQEAKARKRDAEPTILRERVVPILEAAVSAFAAQRIEARIEERFAERQPIVELRLYGPPRRSDGYQLKSLGIAFGTRSRDKIDVFIAKDSMQDKFDRPNNSVDFDRLEAAIEQATEKVLADYFANILNHPAAEL